MSHDSAPLLCGTAAGYIRHIRAGERACEECRAAHTLYVRLWRARGGMAKQRAYDSARQRALSRLARMHPTHYRALYLEERQKDGDT
jgi:muconolactone delta-isomerase